MLSTVTTKLLQNLSSHKFGTSNGIWPSCADIVIEIAESYIFEWLVFLEVYLLSRVTVTLVWFRFLSISSHQVSPGLEHCSPRYVASVSHSLVIGQSDISEMQIYLNLCPTKPISDFILDVQQTLFLMLSTGYLVFSQPISW